MNISISSTVFHLIACLLGNVYITDMNNHRIRKVTLAENYFPR